MESEKYKRIKKLQADIHITRISRIYAEKRLIAKEHIVQAMNIYYSCFIILCGVLTLVYDKDKNMSIIKISGINAKDLSVLSVMLTISLLACIIYFGSQRFLEYAKCYKENYTELYKIELELNHIEKYCDPNIEAIEKQYCDLLKESSNHIAFDYYCALYDEKNFCKNVRWLEVKYHWGKLWRVLLPIFLFILPIFFLCLILL